MSSTLNYQRTKIALAVTGALALSAVSGQAAAAVYAGSKMSITDLAIFVFDSNPVAIPAGNFNFTSTNTAVLNGVGALTSDGCVGAQTGASDGDNCGPLGARLDASQAWAPGATIAAPAQNTFSFIGPNGAQQFARADSNVPTATLPGFNEGTGELTSTNNIAEAELLTLGSDQDGTASAELGSVTGFDFNFNILGDASVLPVTLTASFQAVADAVVDIAADAEPIAIADAEFGVVFTLQQNATNFVRWEPNGNGNADCVVVGLPGVTCTANDGGQDLNQALSIDTIPDSDSASVSGGFSFTILGLLGGDYTLNLTEFKSVAVNNGAIPVPGVLSLLGAGLFGLGWSRRRKAL